MNRSKPYLITRKLLNHWWLKITALGLVVMLWGCAQQEKPTSTQSTKQKPNNNTPVFTQGPNLKDSLHQYVDSVFEDKTQVIQLFEKTNQAHQERQTKALRKGLLTTLIWLEKEQRTADKQSRQILDNSREELNNLLEEVGRGKHFENIDLEDAFCLSMYGLSHLYLERAKQYHAVEVTDSSRLFIGLSAACLQKALVFGELREDPSISKFVKDLPMLQKYFNDPKSLKLKVDQALADLEQYITITGKKV